MYVKTVLLAALSVISANAAIVSFWEGTDCQGDPYGSRNVWDTSCATGTGGFQSFMITTPGGSGQYLRTYNKDGCYDGSPACVDATSVGVCYNSVDYWGGSNAIGSIDSACSA